MNSNHHDMIYEEFKDQHPYIVDDVSSWCPRSMWSIQLKMKNGDEYYYDMNTKSLRKVRNALSLYKDEITDEYCRDSFASNLSRLMREKGYNQQTLSDYTNISKSSINAYINKAKTPSLTNVRKIAHLLDCSINELID